MGWFSNAPTANRIQNTNTIAACVALLEANGQVLNEVNTFASNQINRGQQLSAQAFSVQGAGSQLGRELQAAIGSLGALKTNTSQQLDELGQLCHNMELLIQQFDVPRGARTINASGRDIARVAVHDTSLVLANLLVLEQNSRPDIVRSVQTIDRADTVLNQGNANQAGLNLPGMNFRFQ
ncbi:hypothetical protein [Limnobacter sp.]|uniref:hypothetical protein n=1 Tax=Limnobacter sp. TaxID=2003368 RepID=UPI00351411DA